MFKILSLPWDIILTKLNKKEFFINLLSQNRLSDPLEIMIMILIFLVPFAIYFEFQNTISVITVKTFSNTKGYKSSKIVKLMAIVYHILSLTILILSESCFSFLEYYIIH